MGSRQVEQGVASIFVQFFGIFDDFSKFRGSFGKIIKNSKFVLQIMKKSPNQLACKPISLQHFQTPKLGFHMLGTRSITKVVLTTYLRTGTDTNFQAISRQHLNFDIILYHGFSPSK